MLPTLETLIQKFNLKSHPEGGFFCETYRSAESISQSNLPSRFHGDRNYATAIYFLIPAGTFSALHRIAADEIWHFYLGEPLNIIEIHPDGKLTETVLGQDVAHGQKPQHVVPQGTWFGALPTSSSGYSFVGCTVAPGFDFLDFELASKLDLTRQFPNAKDIIEKMTRS